jgi:ankyrin repeat protein
MRMLLLIALVAIAGCDAGPLPQVRGANSDQAIDYKKYWFATDSYGPLPLDQALESGDLKEVRHLLEQGANPNARWSESGDHFPIQEVLEGHSYGYRIFDPVEAVRLLVKHRADPNERWCPHKTRELSEWRPICTAENGMTPLIFAAIVGQRHIVEMLLAAGADPRARDFTGRSALDYASDEITFEMISAALFPQVAIRDREALDWLKRAGGKSYDPSRSGTPLLRALMSDDAGEWVITPPPPNSKLAEFYRTGEERMLARVRTLLRIGADPNERVRVRSPLALALLNRTLRVARELLSYGANVNERWCELYVALWASVANSPSHLVVTEGKPHMHPACNAGNGITPLMWIAGSSERDGVELLLEFRADRKLTDWAGRSAFDYATAAGIRELLKH